MVCQVNHIMLERETDRTFAPHQAAEVPLWVRTGGGVWWVCNQEALKAAPSRPLILEVRTALWTWCLPTPCQHGDTRSAWATAQCMCACVTWVSDLAGYMTATRLPFCLPARLYRHRKGTGKTADRKTGPCCSSPNCAAILSGH